MSTIPYVDEKTTPKHYTDSNDRQISPIHIIEYYALGFHLGNAVKYILRAGKKPTESVLDDLKKARWYLDRRIRLLEEEQSKGV
jgi:hypothetical protein